MKGRILTALALALLAISATGGCAPVADSRGGTDDFLAPEFRSHSSPARQGIYFFGNGKVRGVVRLDENCGNAADWDIHWLRNQCKRICFPGDYETFAEEHSRLVVCCNGMMYWLPASLIRDGHLAGYTAMPGGVFEVISERLEPVSPGGRPLDVRARLTFFAPPGTSSALVRLTLTNDGSSELVVDAYHTFLPLEGHIGGVGQTNGGFRLYPKEGFPWVAVRALSDSAWSGMATPGELMHILPSKSPGRPQSEWTPSHLVVVGERGLLLRPGGEKTLFIAVSQNEFEKGLDAEMESVWNAGGDILLADTVEHWGVRSRANAQFVSPDDTANGLFAFSLNNLRAVVREDGQMSACVYKGYNDTWVRDGCMAALGLMWAGEPDLARTILQYIIGNVPVKPGEIEEYGMLIYALWLHWVISGDESLVTKHWGIIENGLNTTFSGEHYDPESGLCWATVDDWERPNLGKGYSTTQNVWLWLGLTKAAEMMLNIGGLGTDEEQARKWDALAARIKGALLTDPKTRMIADGHFISRRDMNGEVMWKGPYRRRMSVIPWRYRGVEFPAELRDPGAPVPLEPNSQAVVPYLWGMCGPLEEVSLKTSDWTMRLWNAKWDFGGVARYSVESDPDAETAGPWYFPSVFVARALMLQNRWDEAFTLMDWCVSEGCDCFAFPERAAFLFPRDDPERYFHRALTWTWGEWLMLMMKETAGVNYTKDGIRLEPHIPPRWRDLKIGNVRFRDCRYDISYIGCGGRVEKITLNGKEVTGGLIPRQSGEVVVRMAD